MSPEVTTIIAVVLKILELVAFPAALVIIVAIPWKRQNEWAAIHQKQMDVYTEMTQSLLATCVTIQQGHPAGPALLQSMTRGKQKRQEPEPKIPKRPAGVRIMQKVPNGNGDI